jgi:hypothetical protein
MPALTHGRVKNGFNLFPRTIKYAQPSCNKDTKEEAAARKAQGYNQQAEYDKYGNPVCVNAQRGLCCGSAIQPRNLGPGHLFQRYRVPTKPCNRKHASNVVTGRSFAAKRAIARRSANCNTSHHRTGGSTSFQVNTTDEQVNINDIYKALGSNPILTIFENKILSVGAKVDLFVTSSYVVTKVKDQTFQINLNYSKIYNTIVSAMPINYKIISTNNISTSAMRWTIDNSKFFSINNSTIIFDVDTFTLLLEGNSNDNGPMKFDNNGISTTNCCCLLPTVTHSAPRNAYRMPCSGGPTRRTLLVPCTNPTVKK